MATTKIIATMRIIDKALMLLMILFSLQMVAQCSAKKESFQKHQPSEMTTTFPVNPYVFSAEDYDILQDAGSLQQALSIVSYEPQKIDARKLERGLVKSDDITSEKATQQALHRPNPTQLALEKKYYEVPRKQSRTRVINNPERTGSTTNASKLAAEASSPRRAYELSPENSFHRQRLLSSASTPLPLYPPLTERAVSNFGRPTDNHRVASRADKGEKKKPNRAQRLVEKHEESLAGDRVPRPFSLPTAQTPTATASVKQPQALVATRTPGVRQSSAIASTTPPTARSRQRQDPRSTLSTKLDQEQQQTAPYATEFAHHFSQQEFPAQPVRPQAAPLRHQLQHSQTIQHAIPAARQYYPSPTPYSTSGATASQEQVVTFQPPPRRRNSVRRATSTEQTEPRVKQEQPIVYTIPKRSDRANVGYVPPRQASTIPTRQVQPSYALSTTTTASRQDHQTLPYGTVPARPNPNHPNVPSRRNTARQQVSDVRSTEQTVTQPRTPSRRKTARQDVLADVPPPTLGIEPNSGTMSQPIYVPPTKAQRAGLDSSSQENKDYKEYVMDNDSNEYPNSNENVKDRNNDNKQYSYSHVERFVEPLDASTEQRREPSYEVIEDTLDYPDGTADQAKNSPVLQRGALKLVEPVDYNDPGLRYVEPRAADDYDQSQGQIADQPEVAEAQHRPRGEEADLVQEADHHHKKHHKPKKEHHEAKEGGSEEHHQGEHHEHGEHGKKGYKEHHEHDEGEKGHHDKEKHDHHYDEKEGKDKEHHEEAGFQEHHEKGEEGEKKAAFSEKGHHDKGHSTKGEHVIHKKDEFEKKTEFFDEFHEGGDVEKEGGHHEEHHHKKGGHHKKGHHHKGEHEKHHGEKGHHDKGHHHHEKKGHHEEEGDDHHHHHEERHGKKAGHADHKHWHHKKGDRR